MTIIHLPGRPLPSLAELAELDGDPRVHPNGFIQLDLDETTRLHVWHPRLPYRQRTYHPVHDHVFELYSQAYSGRLVHVVYTPMADLDGTHQMWGVDCISGEETVLRPEKSGTRYRLSHRSTEVVQPGEGYSFPAGLFHETLANEPTLTIMRKIGRGLKKGANSQGARVMVPVGVEPDNDFRRDAIDTDVLWELIAEAHPCE